MLRLGNKLEGVAFYANKLPRKRTTFSYLQEYGVISPINLDYYFDLNLQLQEMQLGGKVVAWWRGLRTIENLPDTWTDFVTVFKGQFLQPPSRTKPAQPVMKLSSRKFSSLEDYVHHTRTQIQKSGLEGDTWIIACFVNGIPNLDYH